MTLLGYCLFVYIAGLYLLVLIDSFCFDNRVFTCTSIGNTLRLAFWPAWLVITLSKRLGITRLAIYSSRKSLVILKGSMYGWYLLLRHLMSGS